MLRVLRAVAMTTLAGLAIAAQAAVAAHGGDPTRIGNSAGAPVAAVDVGGRLVVAWGAADCDRSRYESICENLVNVQNPLVLVARYHSDGRLDESFGDGGVRRLRSGARGRPEVFGLEQGPDGALLIAAHIGGTPGATGPNAVIRLTQDGKADKTFGDRGWVQVEAGTAFASAPDGGFVIAGRGYTDRSVVTVARYSSAGALVPEFGDGGVARFVYDPDGYTQDGRAVEVAADGRILVAGSTSNLGYDRTAKIAVARLTRDGELDSSFGAGDGVTTAAPRRANGYPYVDSVGVSLSLTDTGRVAVGGWQNVGDHGGCPNFALVSLSADGGPDAAYGSEGVTTESPQCSYLHAMAVFSSGAAVATGKTVDYFEPDLPYPVARYTAGGGLDPAFGTDGVVLDRFSFGLRSETSTVSLLNGSPVVGGTVTAPACALGSASAESGLECTALALKAYSGDGSVDRSFGADGLVTIPPITPCRTLDQVACEPALSRKQLRRVVRSGVGSALGTRGRQMRLKLGCPYRLRSWCAFRLKLRTSRRGRPFATLARRVYPGATETARVKVNPGERRKLVRSGTAVMAGKVGVQQKTVRMIVRRPVKRQPAR